MFETAITRTVNSAAPVVLQPGWRYSVERTRLDHQHRLQTGGMHSYLHQTEYALSVPLEFVSSADAEHIRQMWKNGEQVVWTESISSDPKSVVCVIENDTTPFGQRIRASDDHYRGVLFLRESNGQGQAGVGPFILDDTFWGLLDQSYNGLL